MKFSFDDLNPGTIDPDSAAKILTLIVFFSDSQAKTNFDTTLEQPMLLFKPIVS
jgi:hypothetical protein